MSNQILNGRVIQRNDTSANWASINPILLKGEMGVESDTKKFKFGDGTTAWNSLEYAMSGGLEIATQAEAEAGVVDDKAMTPLKTKKAIESLVPMQSLFDLIYPVGSIYMSVNSTSPADLFGGTWDAMPAGRVLLAQGKSQWGTTYAAGSTGGEATHLLTPEEMPQHKHDAVANNVNISGTAYLQMGNGISIATGSTTGVFSAIGSGKVEGYGSGSRSGTNGLKFNSTHTPTISISYTGADTAHNNLQPFIAVFMWRRTA